MGTGFRFQRERCLCCYCRERGSATGPLLLQRCCFVAMLLLLQCCLYAGRLLLFFFFSFLFIFTFSSSLFPVGWGWSGLSFFFFFYFIFTISWELRWMDPDLAEFHVTQLHRASRLRLGPRRIGSRVQFLKLCSSLLEDFTDTSVFHQNSQGSIDFSKQNMHST